MYRPQSVATNPPSGCRPHPRLPLLVVLLCAVAAPAQTLYQPVELGTLGGDHSEAYALNDYTQVVGRSLDDGQRTHAFHWQNYELLDLNIELLFGRRILHLDYGVAYGISNTDHVVGVAQSSPFLPSDSAGSDAAGCSYFMACIYRPAVMTDLTTPLAGDALTYLGTLGTEPDMQSAAAGISSNGRYVVGWSELQLNGQIRAFLVTPVSGLWSPPTVTCSAPHNPYLHNLGTLQARDHNSSATAVNDAGQVVGWSYNASQGYSAFLIEAPVDSDADGEPDQWFVDNNGANALMLDLGTLGGHNSWARDLNNHAQVVGEADVGGGRTHAFLWTPQQQALLDLGTLGGRSSSAAAINDAGQVVGWSLDAAGRRRAFIVTPQDTDDDGLPDQWFADADADGRNDLMRDLNELLPSGFKIRLTEARDINNLGEITGWGMKGTDTQPLRAAFLLTPTVGGDDAGGGGGGVPGRRDVVLAPIQGPPADDGQPDQNQPPTGQPPLGPLHFLCGTGLTSTLLFTLVAFGGLRTTRRRRQWFL